MNKKGYIYILFNKKNGTLYVGVTSDLIKRIYEHKNKIIDGFTKKYAIDKLGYYEIYEDIESCNTEGKTNKIRISKKENRIDRNNES